jgi:hypothetical protein
MEKLPHYNFSWTVSLQKQRNTSLEERLEEALFGDLSLEEAMDLSRESLILELSYSLFTSDLNLEFLYWNKSFM